MRQVVVRVPAALVEDVLDRLLPIVPGGVRERPGGRQVELTMRGDQLPSLREIQRSLGSLPHRLKESEAPDDWRERRLADYEPNVIGGRLLVRPEWAPPAEGAGVSEIVLEETSAFGAGTHPTTRTCVEFLLELEPRGSFADLGCGSGVLAIAAAKLGWTPVLAVDLQPESVAAARANATANGVAVTATELDLLAEPAPAATGLAANVPPFVHAQIAASLPDPPPSVAILSGFAAAEAAEVIGAYTARRFRVTRQLEAHAWVVAVLERS
jgi:ribosomal protein L11 methyltransferase